MADRPTYVWSGSEWDAVADPGAVRKALVSGAGQVIASTAASTPAVVTAGTTDGHILTWDSAVSTKMKWAAPPASGIPATLLDAKGDLIIASGADTAARLPVGTNGQVLKANSATSTGVEWALDNTGSVIVGAQYAESSPLSATVSIEAGTYLYEKSSSVASFSISGSEYDQPSGILSIGQTATSVTIAGSSWIPRAQTWTARTSNFGSTEILGCAFGNGVYLTVGPQGQLRTSTDAVTWTTRTSGFGTTEIKAATYGNGLYVAVGSAGQIRTSTDGITWTSRTSNFGTNAIYAVTYGNGVYVAVGDAGQLRSSTDGITWTTRTSGFGTTGIFTTTYGGGVFVAAGPDGTLTTSTNGTTWTTRTSNFGTTTISVVAFGNGIFVAGGNGGTMRTSTDGTTWTTRTSGFGTTTIRGATYGNGVYVAVGDSGVLTTSTDAITWTTRTSGFGATQINAATYGNGIYVAVGVSGTLTTATGGPAAHVTFAPVTAAT